MRRLEIALLEWPAEGGPHLLGRASDSDLIDLVRDRIAAARRRELAQLGDHLRVADPESDQQKT